METYLVATDVPEFSEKMKDKLEEFGLKEKKSVPVDFLFLSGESAYYRNKIDTKKSTWFSQLWGKSVEDLTNKITLHEKYKDADFLIDSDIITSDVPDFSRSLKIVKPMKGFQGQGITIVTNSTQLKEWISSHSEYNEWLLQDYIRNPALKDGYKFHLRVLVLVMKEHRKPIEAYVATHKFYVKAEEKYVKGDWLNPKIHDTHYKPGKIETFPQSLPDDWKEKDGTTIDETINDMIKELLKNENDFKPIWNAKNGFEVFGVDVIFDKKKPYILEFNNKTSLKGRALYAAPIVDVILNDKPEPYFVRII
jgi:hypothetical protein